MGNSWDLICCIGFLILILTSWSWVVFRFFLVKRNLVDFLNVTQLIIILNVIMDGRNRGLSEWA